MSDRQADNIKFTGGDLVTIEQYTKLRSKQLGIKLTRQQAVIMAIANDTVEDNISSNDGGVI